MWLHLNEQPNFVPTACFKPQDRDKYQFGKTKIFFRAGQVAYLEKLRSEKLRACGVLIQKMVRGWLARNRYRKLLRTVLLVQTYGRGVMARRCPTSCLFGRGMVDAFWISCYFCGMFNALCDADNSKEKITLHLLQEGTVPSTNPSCHHHPVTVAVLLLATEVPAYAQCHRGYSGWDTFQNPTQRDAVACLPVAHLLSHGSCFCVAVIRPGHVWPAALPGPQAERQGHHLADSSAGISGSQALQEGPARHCAAAESCQAEGSQEGT